MHRNFERALSAVLQHEGGYADHAGRHQSAAAMNALRMQATGSTFAGGTVVLEGRRG